MPELKELNANAGEVKQNDQLLAVYDMTDVKGGKLALQHIVSNDGPVVVNEIVTRGSENITMQTSFGKMILRNSAELLIGRMVPTDDEKAATERAYTDECLDRFVKVMRSSATTDVVAWLNEKLADYADDVARGLAWYGEDAMKLSWTKRYAAEFIGFLERETARLLEGDAEARSRDDVFVTWVDEKRKELLRLARGSHSSTSIFSNVSDDMQRVALAKLLEGEFGLGTEYIYYRITQ